MKRRKDCFFGLHFDFHATRETKGIGAFFDAEKLEEILQRVRPDFVQCDTKGHPGISSYPTKVGNPAPDMRGDILGNGAALLKNTAWAVCALFRRMGYRGDSKASRLGGGKGRRYASKDMTSVFGPYVDELLIPQLKELAIDYGLNGAWIDGDCWATIPDYGPRAAQSIRKNTAAFPKNGRRGARAVQCFLPRTVLQVCGALHKGGQSGCARFRDHEQLAEHRRSARRVCMYRLYFRRS